MKRHTCNDVTDMPCALVFIFRTVRSNSRVKATNPNNEKESTTNDNGSSTDEAESEGNNR